VHWVSFDPKDTRIWHVGPVTPRLCGVVHLNVDPLQILCSADEKQIEAIEGIRSVV
jgi:hypothetical protein